MADARYTVLGWRAAGLEARGIEFNLYEAIDQDDNGVWIAPGGTRVAWFSDPDGNTIGLSQPPRP